jgi:hypothetical protein
VKSIVWIVLLASLPTLKAQPAGDFLKPVKDVPLPGKPTRFDYANLRARARVVNCKTLLAESSHFLTTILPFSTS